MIPTGMIAVLVNEREGRQEKAFREVSEKWGLAQSITGPVLSVPYKKVFETELNGEKKVDEVYAYVSKHVPTVTGQNQHPVKKGEFEGQLILGRVHNP